MSRTRVFILVLTSFVIGCHQADEQRQAPQQPTAIDVVHLVPATLEVTLSLPGELSPYLAVDIRARVAGYIATITVDRGSKVRKDEVMVTLRAPELAAQRAEADAKVRAQESTYERLQDAARTPGAVAQHEVELAQTELEAEKAHAVSLATFESYSTIRAPFAGLVTRRNVHPGTLVSPNDPTPLVRLEDVAHLRLTVAVPENASGTVSLGSTATFSVSAYPGVRFSGVIRRSAGSVDTVSRTLPVELDVENADGRLTPGSYTEVDWPVRREHTFVVPRTALVQTPTRLYVVCVRDNKANRVDVRRGLTRGDDVEIFGDVHEGDVVVKRASEDIADGAPVQVR